MAAEKIFAIVDYEDDYAQPLLLAALQSRLPPEVLVLIKDHSEIPSSTSRVLQWRQYESIDFEGLLANPRTCLANSYIIRKALIRKHYLSRTISHWLAKHPKSVLGKHVKPSVEFEVDYAEFLDDALVEAYELKDSWERNEDNDFSEATEWWILKPGMSDRGQGVRLFSSEADLQSIFEEWDPPDSDDEADEACSSDDAKDSYENGESDGILTSQLRHFVAQPYIHPPLLLNVPHPSAKRKFHIRTYVLAVGALQVYVYRPMLALFAEAMYRWPDEFVTSPNEDLNSHLTNTCLQNGDREGSVHAFWSLPFSIPALAATKDDWREDVFKQICTITGEVFEAAARSMSTHFQPLPNAFEIFGVDFLVDAEGKVWLLEVNAFPDFQQTGGYLKEVIQGLFGGVVDVAVLPFFQAKSAQTLRRDSEPRRMVKVLDIDLGRRAT
ncbi:tubulin-tyrosine ligase family-domain-containing protein [Neohortaea acidophila]|uniref:Tubulin-tyrosine ligase family-domain-containing protein n=1 Tax=Neohortaea acidophila TaxID=245834 RepID=A0A6A6Q764_9PEZI|nr:tubulin-tyrosine ligase family-domain-containing protein [Neohortaea acidophila]KAF2487806.1 tubulin-tyrosine ligase family-domain-containing protein [Neohortaea acidophila]